ncbi:LOW QUALITY PROTEIN: hypothetical protein Cgig2_034013 [Carnegiea gigantea]|uniref:Uncharacterized protein n=1 Tax=Carnegiea gigantea TaxID=171969 RepID=A0A9Q1JKI3_9CARY|nr:LOW QUALITY PROTEIN: hypothetical protein Cgig2_034013 [Carnegiea gigantea]
MVKEITGTNMTEKKLWYNLKYDREMLLPAKGDTDVKIIFKGNVKHGYLYVSRNEGPLRVQAFYDGKVYDQSGRSGHDGMEVGREGGRNQVIGQRRRRAATEQAVSGDTIELSDDDEISLASEDAGDKKTTDQGNAGCDEGTKRKGCSDRNDVNDNVWPRFIMQARSYHPSLAYGRN